MKSKKSISERRCRLAHLRPLMTMRVGALMLHIERLKPRGLKALLRAMDSCSHTNCSWVEWEIAQRFRSHVTTVITRKENFRKKKARGK